MRINAGDRYFNNKVDGKSTTRKINYEQLYTSNISTGIRRFVFGGAYTRLHLTHFQQTRIYCLLLLNKYRKT